MRMFLLKLYFDCLDTHFGVYLDKLVKTIQNS